MEAIEIVVARGLTPIEYANQLINYLRGDDVRGRKGRELIAGVWRQKAIRSAGMSTALAEAIVVVALASTTDLPF